MANFQKALAMQRFHYLEFRKGLFCALTVDMIGLAKAEIPHGGWRKSIGESMNLSWGKDNAIAYKNISVASRQPSF